MAHQHSNGNLNGNSKMPGDEKLAALIRDAVTPSSGVALSPARRRRVLNSIPTATEPSAWFGGFFRVPGWGLAAAGAALVLAVGSLMFQGQMAVSDPDPTGAAMAVPAASAGLEVFAEGENVVLRWESERAGAYRVIRSTDPRDLTGGDTEVIQGNSWTDPNKNGARVVFYRVEETEG